MSGVGRDGQISMNVILALYDFVLQEIGQYDLSYYVYMKLRILIYYRKDELHEHDVRFRLSRQPEFHHCHAVVYLSSDVFELRDQGTFIFTVFSYSCEM